MHRLASRGLFACALLSSLAACSDSTPTEPLALHSASPVLAAGVGPTSPNLLTFGGLGGTQYIDLCPSGMVATGTSGTAVRYNGVPAIYNLRLHCRTLNADGTLGGTVQVGGRGQGLGLTAWEPFSADCPDGSIIVGASGLADGLIRAWGVECRSFVGVRASLGPWAGVGTMPETAVAYSGECAPGYGITGLISQAGYVLDGMSLLCSEITGPAAAPTATFSAPSTVREGSPITLAMVPDAAGDLTYAFDCGSGYGAPGTAAGTSCPTTDDATLTVRGRVADAGGLSTEYTSVVTVRNVIPSVAPVPADRLLVGERYEYTGSFEDPGADIWFGYVDYGDGRLTKANLDGKNILLSHVYSYAGIFSLIVRIQDDDSGTGAEGATIQVLSAAQAGPLLVSKIGALVASRDIPEPTARPLVQSIETATKHLEAGRVKPAQNQLNAFKHQVDAAEKSKKISGTVAGSLKKEANRMIDSSSVGESGSGPGPGNGQGGGPGNRPPQAGGGG